MVNLLFDKLQKKIKKEETILNDNLTKEEQHQLNELLKEFEDIISTDENPKLERTGIIKHEIKVTENPIKGRPYPVKDNKKEKWMKEKIDRMLKDGIIKKSKSSWASPVVLVSKKDESIRFCVDYKKTNVITIVDAHLLPIVNDTVDKIGGKKYYTSIDLVSGYWQIEVDKNSQDITAFVTLWGLYQFNVMLFGLTNAPAIFQRLMNYVLHDYLNDFVVVYLDDILVYSDTFEEHLVYLRKVFIKLREANLVIKLKKCKFGQRKIKFLGHTIGTDGLRTDPENIEKIINCPIPIDVTGVRKFMGLCNYYRKFIKDLLKLSKPLKQLLKKDVKFSWGPKEQETFEKLKKILTEAPVLLFSNFDKPFNLCTDASLKGLGAVLEQEDENGNLRPVAYANRSLTLAEKNYHTTDLECLAII